MKEKENDAESQQQDAQKINLQLTLRLDETSLQVEQMLQYQHYLEHKLLVEGHDTGSISKDASIFISNHLDPQLL